ncbi:MAG TPA: HAD-IA family hydrolase [Xanthomonadales bacterium]|nr:HAD-IA family hydrolase [Xanthomonadales bacterium]
MDTNGITHLSFDCYGTLIDWETGILDQALPLLARAGVAADAADVLRAYARHEHDVEAGAFKAYRTVLAETMRRIGADFGAKLADADCAAFAQGLGDWPPFADTVAALARLAARYRLVILSNVDDDLFAITARKLEVGFAAVITAQQVGSYKPAMGHFDAARTRLGLGPHNWIHVAQSLYHDHVPAQSLGLQTLWIERPTRLAGTGIAPPARVKPTARATSLAEAADLLGA